ncbi:VWA domain-containing protein [Paraburkholderia sp.]|uniref:VWA domain-containing protein n=1 Tax=Paraburkholderia sp. TaxID=1926495 RepID=UPI00286F9E4A|nr:VWA domain-containing protein [Paraburkholderia sp.]
MSIDLTAFHFLRPHWLWLLLLAALLPVIWRRRHDVRGRWRGIVEPHLLDHLIVGGRTQRRLRPVDTLALCIALAAVAVAGPAWRQERPPFDQDKAPLVIVLELAPSMDASDIAPTRLERAKQKVLDLAAARKGARTGLVVFASTAHLVVPPTDDPEMLQLYLPALSPALMPDDGKNAAAGLAAAESLLAHDPVPGTIVLISDGIDPAHAEAFVQAVKRSRQQVLWLAVGTRDGGALRGADGQVELDAQGHARTGAFDPDAIRRVADEAGVPLASLRSDGDDIRWVQHRAQTWLDAADEAKRTPRWREDGYWLVLPLILLGLLSFRRGWTVKWLPAVFAVLVLQGLPQQAHAAAWNWLDLFATHDQQGRWYFEHGDYARAAQRFDDPVWKGRAQYQAGDYEGALATFAGQRGAQARFYMGNALAHLQDYGNAIKAYDEALALAPRMREATQNRDLMRTLLAKPKQEPQQDEEDEESDDIKKQKKHGQIERSTLIAQPSDDVWMRGLNTSPAQFLKQRFEQESGNTAGASP